MMVKIPDLIRDQNSWLKAGDFMSYVKIWRLSVLPRVTKKADALFEAPIRALIYFITV